MKPALRVMLCDDAGERFFGEGPCRLLHLIEETGSLRSAAAQMGLSYSKALRLVQHAEKELGFALTCKTHLVQPGLHGGFQHLAVIPSQRIIHIQHQRRNAMRFQIVRVDALNFPKYDFRS